MNIEILSIIIKMGILVFEIFLHTTIIKKSTGKVIKKNNFVKEILINKVFANVMRLFK